MNDQMQWLLLYVPGMLFGALVVGFIAYTWYQVFKAFARAREHEQYNSRQPVVRQTAIVLTKRQCTSGGAESVSTAYYVTFEKADAARWELMVSGTEYGLLVEGDRGTLSTQGDSYRAFDRE